MKKILAIALSVLAFAAVASAQPRAIGARITYGAELSYQHSFGSNFAEFDLGWSAGAINVAGIYDFIFAEADNFNFYAGPGADVCLYNKVNDKGNETMGIGVGIAGQLGAEYEFGTIPLYISLDWRPVFNFIGATGFGWNGFALGVRYAF